MRPVRRGNSPISGDFSDYTKALPELVSRLGPYCSYCERKIPTNLAVEHIQPKALPQYNHLLGRWTNFLVACVNCNSTKSEKDVQFTELLFPDRDNTYFAFQYLPDGTITLSPALMNAQKPMAEATLALTGLQKPLDVTLDANGRLVALDRVAQRMETWDIAQSALDDLLKQPGNPALLAAVLNVARETGFFSVWMTVFQSHPEFQSALIDTFPGTRASECFHLDTCTPISPAPNPDGLAGGSKV